ncbi:MAG: hypothetical protein IT370_27615 [Deltaproteobacteria bacterium]|nr:hypothetical protein [Deltaproteobacteria bacterium]
MKRMVGVLSVGVVSLLWTARAQAQDQGGDEPVPVPAPPGATAPVVVTTPPPGSPYAPPPTPFAAPPQDPMAGAPVVVAPAPLAVDPGPPVPMNRRGRLQDPHIDRGLINIISPTAETQPKGSFSFTDYELFLMGITYGATDNLQVSLTTMAPITEDMPLFAIIGGKLQLLGTGNLHLALVGNLFYGSDGDSGNSADSASAALLGGAVSLCLDPTCASLLSGALQAGFALETDQHGVLPYLVSVSISKTIGRRVKLLAGFDTAGLTADGDNELADGGLLSYGLRFFSSDIAGDVGFIKPVCLSSRFEGDCDGGLVMGVPWVDFSYRWN